VAAGERRRDRGEGEQGVASGVRVGAGMGGDANRRIPAWLVETEDVWGASAPVSPGVIGGDL